MTESAHEYTPTSPRDVPTPPPPPPPPSDAESELAPPPPPATTCTLCDAALEAGAARCGSCGLWAGGHGDPVAKAILLRVGAAFAVLYVLALVMVVLAR